MDLYSSIQSSIIKVIGVGGGGTNAVSHMYDMGIRGVDFAVCNTDNQSLDKSKVPVKIKLGPNLTEGRGAGNNPNIGKQACIESVEDMRRFLADNTKMLFVTAGMGGGTGTGAAPIVAQVARELDILTVAIVTLPFKFEGPRRIKQAYDGLEELKKNVDSLIVISNDKIKEIFGNMSITSAFSQADDILTIAAKGIAEIITVPGNINVDFEDVNFVMRESGVSIMGSGTASGENRAKKAVEVALNSPLLEDNDIRGAKHILLNITSGCNPELTMDEVGEITEYIQEEAGYSTDLIWGYCTDPQLEDNVTITIIATGFDHGHREREEQATKSNVISLEHEEHDEPILHQEDWEVLSNPVTQFEFAANAVVANKQQTSDAIQAERKDSEFKKRTDFELRRDFSKTVGVSLSNPKNIIEVENEPAYKRRNMPLDQVTPSSEISMSNLRVSIEDDKPQIREENGFLHNNVD